MPPSNTVLDKFLNFFLALWTSGSLILLAAFCLICFLASVAWRLQKTLGNGVDFSDFLRDKATGKFTTEKLGHFVAIWVTSALAIYAVGQAPINSVEIILAYGGLWVTSRALDRFAGRNENVMPAPPATMTVTGPAGTVQMAAGPPPVGMAPPPDPNAPRGE